MAKLDDPGGRLMRLLPLSLRRLKNDGVAAMGRLTDQASRDMGIVFGGHIVRQVLGIVSSALLARGLGPEGLSVFAVLGATMMIANTIADFGLSNSAVRLIAGDLSDGPERAGRTVKLYAQFKLTGTLMVFVLIFIFAGRVATAVNLPEQTGGFLVKLASIGMFTMALGSLSSTVLQAIRRFRWLVVTQVVNILLTIALFSVLYLTSQLNVVSALLVGAFTALISAVLALAMWPGEWRASLLRQLDKAFHEGSRLLNYSKWLWISALLSISFSQLDLLLINRYLPAERAGLYALGLNLAIKAGIVNQTVHTVLFPTVSTLSTNVAYRRYLRRSTFRSLILALGIILLLPLARPFILLVYSDTYAPSVGVFYALMVVVLFDLLTIPFLLLAFPLNIPKMIAFSDFVSVVILVGVSVWLLPVIGIYGPIIGKLAGRIGSALVLSAGILRQIHRTSA